MSLQCPKCNGVPNTLLPKDVCNPESSSTVLQCYIEHDQELPLEAAALPFERDAYVAYTFMNTSRATFYWLRV